MKFLADQDVYQITIEFIKKLNHEVIRANEVGLSRSSDREILSWAYHNKCVLLTRDKDFGTLIFIGHENNPGVIFLRIDPLTIESTHAELETFLKKHEKLNFNNYFCVIESGYHRIRRV